MDLPPSTLWNVKPPEKTLPKQELGRHRVKIYQRSFYITDDFRSIFNNLNLRPETTPTERVFKTLKKLPPEFNEKLKKIASKEELTSLFHRSLQEEYELQDFIQPLLEKGDIPSYILAVSRDLTLLKPRSKELEEEFSTLNFTHSARLKEFYHLVLTKLYKPSETYFESPDLRLDPLFMGAGLINETLDKVEKVIQEITLTEEVFAENLEAFTHFQPLLEDSAYEMFLRLLESAKMNIALFKRKASVHPLENILEGFAPQNIESHLSLFIDPIKKFSSLDAHFKKLSEEILRNFELRNRKIGVFDCLLMPMQRVTRYPLLLEALLKVLPEGLAKSETEKRLAYLKKWVNFVNYKINY